MGESWRVPYEDLVPILLLAGFVLTLLAIGEAAFMLTGVIERVADRLSDLHGNGEES
jgi:hypothetical protein